MTVNKEQELVLRMAGTDVTKCMRCGKCTGACPAYNEMEYHPHEFVYMVGRGKIRELMESDSFNHCLSCYACSERCPRGVAPSKLIEAVRLLKIREKGENLMEARELPCLVTEDMPGQLAVSAFRKFKK